MFFVSLLLSRTTYLRTYATIFVFIRHPLKFLPSLLFTTQTSLVFTPFVLLPFHIVCSLAETLIIHLEDVFLLLESKTAKTQRCCMATVCPSRRIRFTDDSFSCLSRSCEPFLRVLIFRNYRDVFPPTGPSMHQCVHVLGLHSFGT